jgi:hypothetical protein
VSEYQIHVSPDSKDKAAKVNKSSVRFNVKCNQQNVARNLFGMAFPQLPNNGTFPYLCLESNEPHKLAGVIVDFLQHLKHAFAMAIDPKKFNGLEVFCLDF